MSPPLQPSSLSSGFFQSLPLVLPAYSAPSTSPTLRHTTLDSTSDDPTLQRLIVLYLPQPVPPHIATHLHDFSRLVLHPSTLTNTVDADTNPPTLHPLTTFGTPNVKNPLKTSPGWKALKRLQTTNGVVGHGYTHPSNSTAQKDNEVPYNLRIHQFLALHIWGPSSAVTTCPMAMTDGAAVLLRNQLSSSTLDASSRAVFGNAYSRLISNDPEYAWTSGQWMTERSGGSDVRGTETVARLLTQWEVAREKSEGRGEDSVGMELGRWVVDGFKWFSSATDADCVVLLAQTEVEGKRVLSAFYAPMRRRVPMNTASETAERGTGEGEGGLRWTTEMNGVYISRLKNKLGTRAVPTAELEIRGMRAHLIGQPGQGVKMISSILNITRLWTANGGVSGWSRGLAISRALTKARKVKGGTALNDNKQHLKWMADETVNYRAMTALYMFGVALLGHAEKPEGSKSTKAKAMGILPDSKHQTEKLLRLLTPVIKMCCSLRSVEGLRACMESLGGVGYCENNEDNGVLNIARLFRDANVNPIWEGTGSVLAEDLLRALKVGREEAKQEFEGVFGKWVSRVTSRLETLGVRFRQMIEEVRARYEKLRKMVESKSEDELLWQGRVAVAHFEAIVCALLLMSDAAVDVDEVVYSVAERWVRAKVDEGPINENINWRKEVEMDRRIFLGDQDAESKGRPKL